jgi:hypothetical protein
MQPSGVRARFLLRQARGLESAPRAGIWRIPMKRSIAIAVAALLAGASLPCHAQPQAAPNVHPAPIIQGQSTTPVAPPGGISQAGVATPEAAPPAPPGPLPPGPPAGDERAAALSNGALIAGGVAVTAAFICAIACFSNSSSTTTSTTVVHR